MRWTSRRTGPGSARSRIEILDLSAREKHNVLGDVGHPVTDPLAPCAIMFPDPNSSAVLRIIKARCIERLLDLAKSVLGDLEAAIAALPRLFDPKSSPAADLPWLASWLAFDMPPRFADLTRPDALRHLIGQLHTLYKRRGTPAGVSEFVEIYTGVRPHLIEGFRERGIWVLGATSALGFDTALPRTSVDGLIVDESAIGATTLTEDGWGGSLFEPTAHRFTVLVPAASARGESSRRFMRDVIEQQKPAHTDFHLCFIEPNLRIGIQSRLGVDAIISGPPQPTPLDSGQALDRNLRLADDPNAGTGAVQRRARIGIDTRLA